MIAWLAEEFNSIQRWDVLLTTDKKESRVPKSSSWWSVLARREQLPKKEDAPFLSTWKPFLDFALKTEGN